MFLGYACRVSDQYQPTAERMATLGDIGDLVYPRFAIPPIALTYRPTSKLLFIFIFFISIN
jgi:hypothetical protein